MEHVKSRLGIMMFLQYAVWGIWMPVLARYLQAAPEAGGLGFNPSQVGWIMGLAGSIGAITAPFVAGQFADRHFSAQRFLAFLLIAGGVVNWVLAYQTTFAAWLVLSIVYSVVYQPTLGLTNSLSFAHLTDASREFPKIRVWGTFGWIAAGWLFPMFWLQTNLSFQALPPFFTGDPVADSTARLADALKVSGVISILYGFYCLTLPHTPPKKDSVEPLAFAKAFRLIKRPSVAVLVAVSLPISVIHYIYFFQTSPFMSDALGLEDRYIAPAMSIGQFAELFVMAGLGLMLVRLGFRWTICIGGLAYFLRYAIFGTTVLPTSIIVSSQFLHGFCYACFFAAGFIYIDRVADADIRHSVQTVFGIILLGVGPVVAGRVLGVLANIFTDAEGVLNYTGLWYTLGGIALVSTLAFALLFRDETGGPAAEQES